MINIEEFKEFLAKNSVSKGSSELFVEFLSSLDHQTRQLVMRIIIAHVEFLSVFIKLIKKKREFAKTGNNDLAKEILEIEKNEINKLLDKIK